MLLSKLVKFAKEEAKVGEGTCPLVSLERVRERKNNYLIIDAKHSCALRVSTSVKIV